MGQGARKNDNVQNALVEGWKINIIVEISSLLRSHWHVWRYTCIHSGDTHEFQRHPIIFYNATVRVVWHIKQLFSWTHRGASSFLQVDIKPIYCKHRGRLSSSCSIHTIEQDKSSMTAVLSCLQTFLSIQWNWKHIGCSIALGSRCGMMQQWRFWYYPAPPTYVRLASQPGQDWTLNTEPSWPNKKYTHDHGRWHDGDVTSHAFLLQW